MDSLVRIKRAVFAGNYRFTEKASIEMEASHLSKGDVLESILDAAGIYKSIRSTSPFRKNKREYLHVIYGRNFEGVAVYSKGILRSEEGVDTYYIFVSAKRALREEN